MLEKIKRTVLAEQTRIIVCAGLGTFLIASSYHSSGRFRVASVNPVVLAIGVVFLLVAWLIYKKWSTHLKK